VPRNKVPGRWIAWVGYLAAAALVLVFLGWQVGVWYLERIDSRTDPSLATCAGVADTRHEKAIAIGRALMKTMLIETMSPALSIAISKRGELVWSEGFGFADLERRVEACPNHQFRVGSVSKPLTAAGMARLNELGRLDLDRNVRTYVPEFPDKRYVITARELASHRAGIRHYHDDLEAISTVGYPNVIASLDKFKDDSLLFPPDTKSSYSSYGYVLLSAVMERAAGIDYRDFMLDSVFAPLGMKGTELASYREVYQPKVSYYDNVTPYSTDGSIVRSPFIDFSYKWAGGGVLSTAEDLTRFGDAMIPANRRGFLRPETIELLLTPRTGKLGFGTAMGWMVGRDPHLRKVAFHFGAGSGARAVLLVLPEQRTAIAVVGNLGHAPIGPPELLRLMNAFAGDPARPVFLVGDGLLIIAVVFVVARSILARASNHENA